MRGRDQEEILNNMWKGLEDRSCEFLRTLENLQETYTTNNE